MSLAERLKQVIITEVGSTIIDTRPEARDQYPYGAKVAIPTLLRILVEAGDLCPVDGVYNLTEGDEM